jgi:hypothetical protein
MLSRLMAICSILLLPPALTAQSNAASGNLSGSVMDSTGAVIPGVVVTVTNELTALSRTNSTDDRGQYRVPLLPPGDYSVRFEKPQFKKQILTGIRVTVGQIAILDAKLEVGGVTETVEVTTAANLIESQRVNQANTLEREAIENLPIGRRDYLTFTLLTPGIVDTTALGDNTDYRPKQTPNSGLSVYGSNGRGNSVLVDGGEMNDAGGGTRSTVTQEAVQEFQINRSNYSAELGGATGAVINIVSKSGTNDTHGTLFGFFRHHNLDAGDPFARTLQNGVMVRTKPPGNREQFGGSLGAPLRKDRTFIFGAFEGLLREESSVVSLLTDTSIFQPTPEQNAILATLPAPMATPLRAALTAPQSTIDLFTSNSGVFPYLTRSWKYSVRLDQNTSRDKFFFRHGYSRLRESNANLQALFGASRGTEVYTLDPTTIGSWMHFFGPNLINEAAVQWNYRGFNVTSAEKLGPEILIAGFGVFNRDFTLPSRTIERRYQMKDNLTYVRGPHTIKLGGEALVRGIHSESEVFVGGRFTFGPLPASLLNPAIPPTYTINSLQAFNLGLAQTYHQGFGDGAVSSNNPYYAFYVEDSWGVRPNLTLNLGLRYELDYRKPPLPTDKNNIGPRVGFAWDPFSDRKTTVRGAYGIFYAPTYYQIDWVVNALNEIDGSRQIAQLFTTIQTPGPLAANNVFSTLRAQGVIGKRSITQADLVQFGAAFPRTGPLPPFATIYSNDPGYVNPYSQQASLSFERELSRGVAVSVGYTFSRTLKIPRNRDRNLLPAPIDPLLGIRVWSDAYFVDPLIAQRNVYESTGRAWSSGMIVELRKRFSRSFSVTSNYTLSRAIDEVVDFSGDYEANDQTNVRAERALSSFDQRHKLVAFGTWNAPAGIMLSPIFRAYSARPFNLLVGFDLNQDRHQNTDRPPFAGRNTGIGPNFWTFDLRLNRAINLGSERRSVDLMIEGFNLFNRLNFASINNTVGVMASPFNVTGRKDRTPSQPLGFTSAYDARKIQLGVRLKF